jgi:predicted Ser/Thr protein kinase
MTDTQPTLAALTEKCKRAFQAESLVRTFREYLDEFLQDPRRHCRLAARYVADCFDHWGTEEVERTGGRVTRWRLFDAPFDGGRGRLVGQEDVQREIYQALCSFAREGFVDRLVLLHGPNGSAKSTTCELIFRALEAYSRTPEGILYRFSWVFPTREAQGKRVGFADDRAGGGSREESYAYLPHEEIAAKIACEMKDPPIFLIPPPLRRELLPQVAASEDAQRTDRMLLEGEPCNKCKTIFDGLYRVARGNLLEVLRHVQVERYYVSQRYRRGAVRISPQAHVDAAEVQVTADRSVHALPPGLQDINLFVPVGDLVDANQGVVEFSDFLKRPWEMNKYLLTTCEKGTISLSTSIAHLNQVMLATTNEAQVDDFKKSPYFTSFNARMDLITVPYLLQVSLEERIYDDTIATLRGRKHVAPHVGRLAAMWAVLSRMHRPDPESYAAELRPLVRELTPLEKARLYDGEEAPRRLPPEKRSLLKSAVAQLREEYRDSIHYEGRYGPSAREMRSILMDCGHDAQSACVSPVALLRQLRRLVKDKTLHEFLRVEPDNGYHDSDQLIEVVQEVYLEQLNEEVRDAMQLVPPDQYRKVFEKYVQHVNSLRTRERVTNPITGKLEEPDQQFINEIEQVIAGGVGRGEFREALILKIAAFRVDHPQGRPDFATLFPEAVQALQDDYYRKHAKLITDVRTSLLRHGTEDLQDVDADTRKLVVATMDTLIGRHGYCSTCAKEAVAFLTRHGA